MSDYTKKISIITLTYNNWRLLDTAINSVNTQKIDAKYEVEYLIVDDGTVDFNMEYVQSLLNKSQFTTKVIVNKLNLGTVASFNQAIRKSRGDIIIPLSADDEFYNENVVSDIINYFDEHNSMIITGIREAKLNRTTIVKLPLSRFHHLFETPKKLLKELVINGNVISGASTYYRREIFEKIGFFDENYFLLEDYPFYIKCLKEGGMIDFLSKPVIKYSVKGISNAANMHPLLKSDYARLNDKMMQEYPLTILDKRRFIFNRLSRGEKIMLVNILKYPEQYLIRLYARIVGSLE